MHLKSLEISGFKSFAKKTTLKFKPGITAIVGPNGSGKSNVADALRWVMGEQSIKSLRGKKSEDIIFSGSDKKTRLGLAEVSLELDNSDKQIPIDYSEVVITRKLYRDGESQYLINQHKSRLNDVNLLLTKANFGHRTYSVIGQGTIDNFLISTPQERKTFFEEATGVKQYQIKKQVSLKKLERVWQNLNTIKIKLSEMEPHLRLLTRQVKKLRKRKELENQLLEYKKRYYLSFWQEINSIYQEQQLFINSLIDSKIKLEKEHQQFKDQVIKLTKNNQSSQIRTELRQTEKNLINQKIKLKENLLNLQFTHSSLLESANKNKLSLKFNRADIRKIDLQLQTLNKIYQSLKKLIGQPDKNNLIKNEIKNELEKINQITNFILKIFNPLIKQVNHRHQYNEFNNNLNYNHNQEKINQIKNQLTKTEEQINNIQQQIEISEKEDDKNKSILWKIQNKFNQIQNKLNEINLQINQARINLTRTETRRFDLQQEIKYELPEFNKINNYKASPLTEQDKHVLYEQINKIKNQLEIIGGLDPEIEQEYQTLQQNYDFLKNQSTDLEKTIISLKKLIYDLNTIIKNKVKSSYEEINKYFKKYFNLLFNGGHAELTLVKDIINDNHDTDINQENNKNEENNKLFKYKQTPSFSGIEINATPPGKKLKSINALSGGERALTSIALICAILSSNPAPFVVLDEVDAALDESNTIRFANILKDLSHKTQFIVITHNRATMEQASLIYGITMGDDGISKLLSIKLDEIQKYKS